MPDDEKSIDIDDPEQTRSVPEDFEGVHPWLRPAFAAADNFGQKLGRTDTGRAIPEKAPRTNERGEYMSVSPDQVAAAQKALGATVRPPMAIGYDTAQAASNAVQGAGNAMAPAAQRVMDWASHKEERDRAARLQRIQEMEETIRRATENAHVIKDMEDHSARQQADQQMTQSIQQFQANLHQPSQARPDKSSVAQAVKNLTKKSGY